MSGLEIPPLSLFQNGSHKKKQAKYITKHHHLQSKRSFYILFEKDNLLKCKSQAKISAENYFQKDITTKQIHCQYTFKDRQQKDKIKKSSINFRCSCQNIFQKKTHQSTHKKSDNNIIVDQQAVQQHSYHQQFQLKQNSDQYINSLNSDVQSNIQRLSIAEIQKQNTKLLLKKYEAERFVQKLQVAQNRINSINLTSYENENEKLPKFDFSSLQTIKNEYIVKSKKILYSLDALLSKNSKNTNK